MASVRINVFANISGRLANEQVFVGAASLNLWKYYFPGSLSFNNVALVISGSGGVSENLTLSFGLYSSTGSSLSLANSASLSAGLTLNQTTYGWFTMATSATQDITPGNWYLAMMSSTSLGGSWSVDAAQLIGVSNAGNYAGPFFGGYFSASTGVLPSSIATSDCIKADSDNGNSHIYPVVLISA